MDVTNLILYLKSKITSNSIDQQMVSKAIRLLELGAVFTAQSFAALPSPVGRSGELWYVMYDGLYWSTGELWLPIAQTSTGFIWAWGGSGLGDDTATNRSSPVSVVGGFTDWCQVTAGGSAFGSHTLAVRSNGSAWAWGTNTSGRLGDNTITARSSPVSVVGGFTNWCQVSAGGCHSLGILRSGSAWAWGCNGLGRLGDNTTTNRSSPVSVVGGFTDWCAVSAGGYHSLALRTNGTAWLWGAGSFGRLGDNTVADKSSPVSVVGGFSDWCQASAGINHTLAVRTGGSAWSWGLGNSGQLGIGAYGCRSSPVSVVGGFTDWRQASAACGHSVAVRTSGSAWAWGGGSYGVLGNNGATNSQSPENVVGGFTDWCAVSGGTFHTLALRTQGSSWSWGRNNVGQIGDNTTVNKSSPVSVVGGFTDWCQVSASHQQSFVMRSKTL
jgi:alpha-tubulin suppressor-like RCC1 family protein